MAGDNFRDYRHKIKNFSERREKLHEVIFEADTPHGKQFDIALLIIIVLSVIVVMLESVPSIHERYGALLLTVEWVLTIFFTFEYILRLYCVYRPMRYATSFFGIVDLIAIIPTYLTLFMSGATQSLAIIRALRLLRIFRIFKLANFMTEGSVILHALKASRSKISVFLFAVLILVSIFGSIMYVVEGGHNQAFDSIPRSIYWAIVTLTTVGYGDISPTTPFGQFLASMIMIMGYAIIAVPTGIVSAEAIKEAQKSAANHTNTQVCRYCADDDHEDSAKFCKTCGEELRRPGEKFPF